MGAEIRLLLGVTLSVTLEVANCRENFATLATSIVFLPRVRLEVYLQVT